MIAGCTWGSSVWVCSTCLGTKHGIPCYSHTDRFSKHLLQDVRTDGYRVLSELEKTTAMLFIHSFIYLLSAFWLVLFSSVGCNTWGREAETCLVQPLGSDPNFGWPCTGWTVWWHLSWGIQLYTDKSVASFLPSYSGGKVSSIPPTRNELHGVACALCVFVQKPPPIPRAVMVFCDKPKLLIHKSFNRFQSLSAPISISDPAVYMSNLPGPLLQITGLGLCWLVAWSGASFLSSVQSVEKYR